MITFKGRSTLKQYMPQKPVKRGIKVWALADAINGFVSMFQVYTDKQGNTVQKGLGANGCNNSDEAVCQHIQACLF